jgi:hypothetical protein
LRLHGLLWPRLLWLILCIFMCCDVVRWLSASLWSSCARNICAAYFAGRLWRCSTFSLFLTSGICREYVRIWGPILYNSNFTDQNSLHGQYAHAIYVTVLFSVLHAWLERVLTIIKLLWIYVRFLIIACCLIYHAIQTKSVTRKMQQYS